MKTHYEGGEKACIERESFLTRYKVLLLIPASIFTGWILRVYGQFCIKTLHEIRKRKSNGLSCLFEQENKMSKL